MLLKLHMIFRDRLPREEHRVVFYASDMEDWLTRGKCGSFIADGIRIRRFKTIGTMLSRKFKIYVTPSLIRTNNEIRKFSIIHLQGYRSFQNMVIHNYSKRYGVPYVLQARGSLPRVMTESVIKLLKNNAKREEIGKNARSCIFSRFNWKKLCVCFLRHIKEY